MFHPSYFLFNDSGKTKSHLQVIKVMHGGSFYATNHETNAKQLQKILKGQVIYDLSSLPADDNIAPGNSSITNFQGAFNPNVNNHEEKLNNKTFFQEAETPEEEEKLIAGYTYPEESRMGEMIIVSPINMLVRQRYRATSNPLPSVGERICVRTEWNESG